MWSGDLASRRIQRRWRTRDVARSNTGSRPDSRRGNTDDRTPGPVPNSTPDHPATRSVSSSSTGTSHRHPGHHRGTGPGKLQTRFREARGNTQ